MADNCLQTIWAEKVKKERKRGEAQNNHCLTNLRNGCCIDRCGWPGHRRQKPWLRQLLRERRRKWIDSSCHCPGSRMARSSPPPLTSLCLSDINNLSFHNAGLTSPFLSASLSEAARFSFDPRRRRWCLDVFVPQWTSAVDGRFHSLTAKGPG